LRRNAKPSCTLYRVATRLRHPCLLAQRIVIEQPAVLAGLMAAAPVRRRSVGGIEDDGVNLVSAGAVLGDAGDDALLVVAWADGGTAVGLGVEQLGALALAVAVARRGLPLAVQRYVDGVEDAEGEEHEGDEAEDDGDGGGWGDAAAGGDVFVRHGGERATVNKALRSRPRNNRYLMICIVGRLVKIQTDWIEDKTGSLMISKPASSC
jgi:hypothetical protein